MWVVEVHNSRAPTAGFRRRIAKGGDERRPGEHAPHLLALHSDAAPVDDPQRAETEMVRFGEVLFDHILHVARGEGVEIQNVRHLKLKKPGIAAGLLYLDFRFLFFAHPTISLPHAADCNR